MSGVMGFLRQANDVGYSNSSCILHVPKYRIRPSYFGSTVPLCGACRKRGMLTSPKFRKQVGSRCRGLSCRQNPEVKLPKLSVGFKPP